MRCFREPWLAALLLLGGCLTFLVPSPCDESECGGYACDPGGFCLESCDEDWHCAAGLICDISECVEPCEDQDCPGYLICEEYLNECRDQCILDKHCRGRRVCDPFTARCVLPEE